MSERLLGAVIAVHGDDRGIVFPPAIAPYQIVLVPILVKGKKEDVTAAAEELMNHLKEWGYRAHLDVRDIRPGAKYYDWEMKGVPLRLELGPRDIKDNKVVVVRRDTGKKEFVKREMLWAYIQETTKDMEHNLLRMANERLISSISLIRNIEEGKGKNGILKMHWCGMEECAREVETGLELTILGTPLKLDGVKGKCVNCGKPAETVIYASKTY